MAESDHYAPVRPTSARAPLLLTAGFVVFVGVLAALVGAAFARRHVPTYAPSLALERPTPSSLTTDTVTIDARDPVTWRYFSFARGVLPSADTAGWDLAFRRFQVIASGAVAADSAGEFEQLREASLTGYTQTVFGSDTVNPTIDRWYRYSYITHLLTPGRPIYVVRTAAGRYAKLAFLSYYCPGPAPGCVTFQYTYRPDGGRLFQ
jgi:hypothetical protein